MADYSYRGAKRKYTKQQVNEARELRKEGFAFKEISELTRIPMGSLGAVINKKGAYAEINEIPVTIRTRKEVSRKQDPLNAVLMLFCQGKTSQAISSIVNIPESIVDVLIEDAKQLGKIKQTWTIVK